MDVVARRFDVFLVCLDPTMGSEIRKTRPCVVVSPDEMNERFATIIVAPMTTQSRGYPWRIRCRFQEKEGRIILDQIRTVDKLRLLRLLGRLEPANQQDVLLALQKMFSP